MDDDVESLTVIDDGSGGGPALYVGGTFTVAGAVPANNVAKWDGTNWSALAGGMKAGASTTVSAMAKFDDGSGAGPAIYAGGIILGAGTAPAIGIAQWDNVQWTSLGNGITGSVAALAVFDDGNGGGEALYAAGSFTGAGGIQSEPHREVGRRELVLSIGNGSNFGFASLAVYDDGLGGGPALYAGEFLSLFKWDGNSFTAVAGGPRRSLVPSRSSTTVDGPALYAGGFFSSPREQHRQAGTAWGGARSGPA